LNTEIETLGQNLTDALQKENDTATSVSETFLKKIHFLALAFDDDGGDGNDVSDDDDEDDDGSSDEDNILY